MVDGLQSQPIPAHTQLAEFGKPEDRKTIPSSNTSSVNGKSSWRSSTRLLRPSAPSSTCFCMRNTPRNSAQQRETMWTKWLVGEIRTSKSPIGNRSPTKRSFRCTRVPCFGTRMCSGVAGRFPRFVCG